MNAATTVKTDRDGCLDIDVLVAMTEGTLATDHSESVLAHVDRCARCAEVIAKLGALDGPARRVGRYQIERVLGVGGMGIVYAAFDPQLQRRVAVKLVRPESMTERTQALMVEEARTLAQISHPNVVTVHDAGEHDGEIYLATELVDGTTLAEWQAEPRSTAEIVGVWLQVARGLAAAHAIGVIHRDVKPSNVLLGRDGRVRIGDFGIAQSVTGDDGALFAGTPAYMAPEHRAGNAGARSDQYSACVAIVEALTGARLQADEQVAVEPRALAAVLTRGLRADPAQRWPTMDAFADALAAAVAPRPRRMAIVAATATAAIAIGGLAVLWIARSAAPACTVAAVPDSVWSARRESLARRLPANVAPYIEHWLAAWANAAGDVCASRPAGVRAQRRACLARTLGRLDELLASWEAGPPGAPIALFVALEELPHPAWCSEPSVMQTPPDTRPAVVISERELAAASSVAALAELRTRTQDIASPALATHVALALAAQQADTDRAAAARTLRAAVADARGFPRVEALVSLIGLLDADQVSEAEQLAATTRKRLAELGGDPALEAELDFQLGTALHVAGREQDAVTAFERARQSDRIAHGPDSLQEANTLVALAGALAARDGSFASSASREASKAADAIFARHNIAMPSINPAETPAELLDQMERMRALAVARSGPESEAAFDGECNLVNGYVLADQPERALEHARLATALARKLGLRTPKLAYVLTQSALLANDLDHAADALALAREAVTVATELGVDGELASALTALGRASVEAGQPADARAPLQRALAIEVRRNDDGRIRGITRFWLAQALWTESHARALEQATIAREEIRSFLDAATGDAGTHPVVVAHQRRTLQAMVDKLERWIREHRA